MALRVIAGEKRRSLLQRLTIHPLFREMAVRQGINLGGGWTRGVEHMLLDALDRCAACAQTRSCRAWMARTPHAVGPPRFCPNGRILAACRIMDPRAATDERPDPMQSPQLAELLSDPLVARVMRAARFDTMRLLAKLSGRPRRLVERVASRPRGP